MAAYVKPVGWYAPAITAGPLGLRDMTGSYGKGID